jgi:transcriptional regulator with XRE-family HTH domain
MSFDQHLPALREGAGLSRAELARKAGVRVSTLRDWEGDRAMPGRSPVARQRHTWRVTAAGECRSMGAAPGR